MRKQLVLYVGFLLAPPIVVVFLFMHLTRCIVVIQVNKHFFLPIKKKKKGLICACYYNFHSSFPLKGFLLLQTIPCGIKYHYGIKELGNRIMK